MSIQDERDLEAWARKHQVSVAAIVRDMIRRERVRLEAEALVPPVTSADVAMVNRAPIERKRAERAA